MKRAFIRLVRGICNVAIPLGALYFTGGLWVGIVRGNIATSYWLLVATPTLVLFVLPSILVLLSQPHGTSPASGELTTLRLTDEPRSDFAALSSAVSIPSGSASPMHGLGFAVLTPLIVLTILAIAIGGLILVLKQLPPGTGQEVGLVAFAIAFPVAVARFGAAMEKSFKRAASADSAPRAAWIRSYWPSLKRVVRLTFIGIFPVLLAMSFAIAMMGG